MPFVKRHRTYYKYGTEPNATVVGSFARIEDGVASGFTTSNYLTFDIGSHSTSDLIEVIIPFNTGTWSDTSAKACNVMAGSAFPAVQIFNQKANLAGNGTYGTYTYSTNEDVVWKIQIQNGTGNIYRLDTSTNEFVLDYTFSYSTAISGTVNLGYSRSNRYLANGSIDLTQSYININGERWWSGDSYIKVGSWIEDGIVSGFSSSNYTRLPFTFEGGSYNNWELVTKIKVNSYSNAPCILCVNSFGIFNYGVSSEGLISLALSTNTTTFNICSTFGTTTLELNAWYWLKAEFTGTAYNTYLSTDGKEWNLEATATTSTKLGTINTLNFGLRSNVPDSILDGYIDMQETYFKANGSDMWHGTKAYQLNIDGEDVWEDWKQPVLSANGTMGGDNFAVAASSEVNSNRLAWQAFNGDTTSGFWGSVNSTAIQWLSFYNPKPLKVTALEIYSYYDASDSTYKSFYIKEAIIQGSNDNSNWTDIKTITNSAWVEKIPVDLSDNNKAYKYYRIYITDRAYYSGTYCSIDINEVKITAKELVKVGDTIEEADYHVDRNKLYQLAAVKRSYYKYDYQNFVQPVLSANGTLGGKSFACTATDYMSSYVPYYALDNNSSTQWRGNSATSEFTIYNPIPIKISRLSLVQFTGSTYNYWSTSGNVYGSNDNSSWTLLTSYTNNVKDFEIDLSTNNQAFKYYKIQSTASTYHFGLTTLTITAQEQISVAGTSTDYDYYTDKLLSYETLVGSKATYWKYYLSERDTNTYTFTLDRDYTAKLLFVGNGGGGCSSQKDSRWHYSSGGSGACFEGLVRLPADTYTLTIGTLGYGNNYNNTHYWSGGVQSTDSFLTNSAGEELIRVGAGGMGYTSVGGVGGAAGVLTLGTLDIIETKKATDGVYTAGNTSAGSVSAYDGTYSGYGAGTGSQRGQGDVYGIKGIFDLTLQTDNTDYDYVDRIVWGGSLTIKTLPENAIVTINGMKTNSVILKRGSVVQWEVSLDGWTTQAGEAIINIGNKEITVDLKKEFPAEPTYTTLLHAAGANASQSMTVEEEGWYRFHYYNTYGASDRWGYASIDGVTKYSWQSSQNSYTDPIYLEAGQVVRVWNNGNGYTLNTYFEQIT